LIQEGRFTLPSSLRSISVSMSRSACSMHIAL
jgi:hypothetical protein